MCIRDRYEPQETQRVTIVSGQTATVNFNNVLKRGSLEVTKTSEDGLVEGMTFHPVSYTHLDVYKRQVSGVDLDVEAGQFIAILGHVNCPSCSLVSCRQKMSASA